MSDVGDLLELLHGARGAYRSARASIRTWRDEALYREARQRAAEATRGGARSVWVATLGAMGGSGDPRASGSWETRSRVWVVWPSQVRCDRDLEWQGEKTAAVTVVDGDRWWQDSPSRGFSSSTDAPRTYPVVAQLDLLDPWELAGDLHFEVRGSVTCAGREAISAVARVQAPRTGHSIRVVPGAQQYEVVVDGERGVVLRSAALLDGAPFEIREVTEIAFDEQIDPGLFRLEPPPPEERRPARRGLRSACSFCGKPGEEVEHLVVGEPVYICNECVGVSKEIVRHER